MTAASVPGWAANRATADEQAQRFRTFADASAERAMLARETPAFANAKIGRFGHVAQ
jgi:hypothetical protein